MRRQGVATSVLLRPSRIPDDLLFLRIVVQSRHATIWLCEDGRTGEQIACKKILKSTLRSSSEEIAEADDSSPAARAARLQPSHDDVRREVAVAEGLSGKHPSILTFKGAFEDADAVYLTSEFCDSGDLLTYIVESAIREGARAPDVYNLADGGGSTASCDDGAFGATARSSRGISRSISRSLRFQRENSGRKLHASPGNGDIGSRDVSGGGGRGGWGRNRAWALPEPEARTVFRQVAAAVQFCHQSGVAHGEIRLENVLLSSRRFAPGAGAAGSRRSRARSLSTICSAYPHGCASETSEASSSGFAGDGLVSPRAAPHGGSPAVFAKLANFGSAERVAVLPAVVDAAADDVAAADGSGDVASVESRIHDAVKRGSFGGKSRFGGEECLRWMQCAAPELIVSEIESTKSGVVATTRKECPMKADVWSLGVVLFALLSSSVPFSGPHERKIIRQIAHARHHLERLVFCCASVEARSEEGYSGDQQGNNVWLQVSAEAKDLIRGMLEIEPSARLSINEVVSHPWLSAKDVKARRGPVKCAGGLGSVCETDAGSCNAGRVRGSSSHAQVGESSDFPPLLRRRNTFSSSSAERKGKHKRANSVSMASASVNSAFVTSAGPMRVGKFLMRTISRSIGNLAELGNPAAGNRYKSTTGAVSYRECDSNSVGYMKNNKDDDIWSSSSTAEGGAANGLDFESFLSTSSSPLPEEATGAEAEAAEYRFSLQTPEELGAGEGVIALGPIRGLRHRTSITKGGEVSDKARAAAAGAAALGHPPFAAESGHCLDSTATDPSRAWGSSFLDASQRSSHPAATTATSPSVSAASLAMSSTDLFEHTAAATAAAGTATSVSAWGRSYTHTGHKSSHTLQSACPFLSPSPSVCSPGSPAGGAGGNPSPGHSSSGGESDGDTSSGSKTDGFHLPVTASSSGSSDRSSGSSSGSSLGSKGLLILAHRDQALVYDTEEKGPRKCLSRSMHAIDENVKLDRGVNMGWLELQHDRQQQKQSEKHTFFSKFTRSKTILNF
ncbi:unnamed protein product [Closterium sp. NIES-54]